MVLSPDVITVVVVCLQQLGMTLAVGAEATLLVAYLSSVRDGVIDKSEDRLAHALQNVLYAGVVFVIVSGAVATLMELQAGHQEVVLAPAFLFKWVLIAVALLLGASWYELPQSLVSGLSGGVWSALFVLHTLAPATTWATLLMLFVIWMIGFNLCWWVLVYELKPHKKNAAKLPASATLAPPPPPPSKPVAPPPPPPPPKPVTPLPPPPSPVSPPKPVITASPPPPAPSAPTSPLTPRPLQGVTNTLPLQREPLVSAPRPVEAPVPAAPQQAPVKKELPPGVVVMPKSPEELATHQ
jgi:hypothetical protein